VLHSAKLTRALHSFPFPFSGFDRSLNKSQFRAALKASQLVPKSVDTESGSVDKEPTVDKKDKGKEKEEAHVDKPKKLGLSQALGKAWRTASAVMVRDYCIN
jgi:hypothetical protein